MDTPKTNKEKQTNRNSDHVAEFCNVTVRDTGLYLVFVLIISYRVVNERVPQYEEWDPNDVYQKCKTFRDLSLIFLYSPNILQIRNKVLFIYPSHT